MPLVDRTWYATLVDDDGSGTTGSIIDKAAIDALLDAVDVALAGSFPQSQITGLVAALAATEKSANKNAANGYAGLDASSKLTGAQQVYGTAANTAAQGNDARLSDARTPTAHAPTHKSAGSDPIKLDELAAPTDITTLNVSTTAHGLAPKLPNDATKYLDGTGAYTVPAGAGGGAPAAHHLTHESGGTDAIKLDDLAAPDDNTDLDASTTKHGLLKKLPGGSTTYLRGDGVFATPPGGGGSGTVSGPVSSTVGRVATWNDTAGTVIADGGVLLSNLVVTSDSRLTDARTPTAHATSHKSAGSDPIKLDELAAPTDVTTLNASTTAHGLLKKLSNVATEFLNGQGAWATPAGGASGGASSAFRALHLRTHPDSDVRKSKVMLVHADEIVFDDGYRESSGLDRLVGDMTVSGAGGLDTGTEGAGRWYEVYAIRKSSDGTKALLLHFAGDHLTGDSYTPTLPATAQFFRDTTAHTKLAQSFAVTSGGNYPCEYIDLAIGAMVGAPTGNIWLTIEADSAGAPSGTPLATSNKLDLSVFSVSFAITTRFLFGTPATLTNGSTYWIVINGDNAINGTAYIAVRGDSAGYAGGAAKQYSGSAWSAASSIADLWFKVWPARNTQVAVTMPAGYDQKCLIGFVYNDAGSDFRPFIQRDRDVTIDQLYTVGSTSNTYPTLMDLSAFVPPRFVSFKGAGYNSGAGNYVAIQASPDGYSTNFTYPTLITANTANRSYMIPQPVPTQAQSIFLAADAGTATMQASGFVW